MTATALHYVVWTTLAVVGLVLLGTGGYTAVGAYDRMGTCGDFDVSVEQVPESSVDDPGEYEGFADLSDRQQAVFERALNSGGQTLVDGSLDHFDRVEYQGDYYRATPSLRVCDFSPGLILRIGVGLALVGLTLLGAVGLWVRRVRTAGE